LLGARTSVVGKPIKHGDKWSVRWLNEHGKRRGAVYDDYKRAPAELRRKQVEVKEIKRGVRNATLGGFFRMTRTRPTPPRQSHGRCRDSPRVGGSIPKCSGSSISADQADPVRARAP
jgi:hypothetical protein